MIGRLLGYVRGWFGGGDGGVESAPPVNCRAGDLARIVAFPANDEGDRLMPGRIVRLVEWFPHPIRGWAMWRLEAPLVIELSDGGQIVVAIADKVLRPIRDPGDDAQDEMLALVGPAPVVAQSAREEA